jgi:hypothetical protein
VTPAATNEGVFRCLKDRPEAKRGETPLKRPDDPEKDYYYEAGAHPEVVARLWDQIGKTLPADCRALVFGTPVLAHPDSGVILAFALGTEYVLRLPRRLWRDERPAGLRTVAKWTFGGSTDITRECGQEWIFGSFAPDEIGWCAEMFRECVDDAG